MGIYLFGELIISQQPKQKQLVLEVLSIIGAEMDQCTLKTVQDMLDGKDWLDLECRIVIFHLVNRIYELWHAELWTMIYFKVKVILVFVWKCGNNYMQMRCKM